MKHITKSALIKRINRKLSHEQKVLRKNRSIGRWPELGEHYIVNLSNHLQDTNVSPINLGLELGLLSAGEADHLNQDDAAT